LAFGGLVAKKQLDALSFEEIMDELEKSVADLENGKLPLNKASEVYEKGMKLAEEANKRLSDTEIKITDIKKAFEEKIEMSSQSEDDLDI
jgi:exodeoxyribonuclease VII small subunit|tara:strand:+ start:5519 stop:5788 length:270 start_codon:yes stop_codon:yes gene_type:complete